MAAYVNRTISMMAGDGPHNVGLNGNVRVNMSNVDSPLQIFVRAKKKINDIFVEIDDYVKDAVTFMHGKFYFCLIKYDSFTNIFNASNLTILTFFPNSYISVDVGIGYLSLTAKVNNNISKQQS